MSDDVPRWRATRDKDGNLTWEKVPPYDINAALRECQPEVRGRDYGVQNQVQIDTSLTHSEIEMLTGVNDHIATSLQDWHIQCSGQILREVNDACDDAKLDPERQCEQFKSGFKEAAETIKSKFRADHELVIGEERRKRKTLIGFKNANGLRGRDARYPESPVLHFAVLFLVLVVEGAFNAFFFADNPLGLLGGFFRAFMIAAVNVAVCFVVGRYLLTQLNLNKWGARKWLGLILLLVCVAFVISFHLAVAHWREALVQNIDADLFTSLAFDPRTLQDMQSLALIGLGMVASVIAIIDGYTLDDPYPGYGDIYRDWKMLDKQVREQYVNYQHSVNESYHDELRKMLSIPDAYDAIENKLKKLKDDISIYFACVESYYNQAQNAAVALITTFRKEVEDIWEMPRSFPVSDALIESKLEKLDPAELKEGVRRQLEHCFNALESARTCYKEIKERNLKELERIRDKLISAESLNKMLNDIHTTLDLGENRDEAYVASLGVNPQNEDSSMVDASERV